MCMSLGPLQTHTHSNTPHTNLHFLPLNIQGSYSEIHPNGVLLFLWEKPWLKILNHAGFSYIRVSNQDDLKQEIKRIVMFGSWGLHVGGRVRVSLCGCESARKEQTTADDCRSAGMFGLYAERCKVTLVLEWELKRMENRTQFHSFIQVRFLTAGWIQLNESSCSL